VRFDKIAVENTYENREAYRTLLLTTPGLEEFICGVILFEETLENKDRDGVPLMEHLARKGIIPGIKVDKGVVKLMGLDNETATQGLDGLAERCQGYYAKGCRFAKWRAVLRIGADQPSALAIEENAHTLARYASICQMNGLVPIVEPEIIPDGTHTIEECAAKSKEVFSQVVRALHLHNVILEGALLKPNMITPGMEASVRASPEEIAFQTIKALARTIPASIPGVMFLSGGQSEEEASLNLNAMNAMHDVKRPWTLSFSYGRALQQSVLAAWSGKLENEKVAQDALLERASANSRAGLGTYTGGSGSTASTYQKNYTY
jgi:fructose-bisphosphate aldolase class I